MQETHDPKTNHLINYSTSPDVTRDPSEPNQQDQANTALDIQDCFLGSLMIDPDQADLAAQMRASFFDGSRADIAQAVLDAATRYGLAEITMVLDLLRERGQLDADSEAEVMQLPTVPSTSSFAPHWARRITESAQRRDRETTAATYHAAVMRGDPNALATLTARLDEIAAYVPQQKKSRLKTVGDAIHAPDPDWNIRHVIQEQSTALFFAETGSGKTYRILEWLLLTALGMARGASQWWEGHEVKPGHVIYVAGEGAGTLLGPTGRFSQWLKLNQVAWEEIEPYFHWHDAPVPLMDGATIDTFIRDDILPSIPEGEPLRFVAFDTLASCMAGGKIIDNDDAATAIRHCNRIVAATKACVMLMHHTNRSDAYLGAGAWIYGIDTVYRQTRDKTTDVIELVNEKQRGANTIAPMYSKFEQVYADESLTLTTRRFVRTDMKAPEKTETLKPNERKMLIALAQKFGGAPGATYSQWKFICDVPAGSVDRAIAGLKEGGYVLHDGQHYCLSGKGKTYHQSLSNYHHDGDDGGVNQPSSPSLSFRSDGDDGYSDVSPDDSDTAYQVASTAPIFDAPHSKPSAFPPDDASQPVQHGLIGIATVRDVAKSKLTHQPDAVSPPPSVNHVTQLDGYRRQPTNRPPAPDAWQVDREQRPVGQRCTCGDLARKWEWNESRGCWICPACGSPDTSMKGA